MDFLGIGPLEVLFILIIALIIFGPKDIVKAGQVTGRFLRKLVTSPSWRAVQQTSRDLRNLPNKLMREAGLEEIQQDLKQISPIVNPSELQEQLDQVQEGLSAWTIPSPPMEQIEETKPPTSDTNPTEQTENN